MLLRPAIIGQRSRQSRRGGFVILAVLMVITVLTLAAYQFVDLMSAEAKAADRIRKTTESKAFAMSGIHYAMALIADPDAFEGTLSKNPFDNSAFQGVIVKQADQGSSQGRFTIVALDFSQSSSGLSNVQTKSGLSDEGGKLNINALYALDSSGKVLHDALMKLPDMTDEIAWSIVDWIDADDEPNAGGAESQYYAALQPPYQCKNAPLDTVEELLLVQGVTPALLFGNDRNRNGKLDPGEDDGFGGYNPGWASYLTVYSRERNVDSTGAARVNLNGDDLNQLKTDLTTAVGEDTAYLILAYRLYGAATGMQMGGGAAQTGSIDQLKQVVNAALQAGTQARQRVSSVFALVNAQIRITIPAAQPGMQARQVTIRSPLQSDVALQRDVLPKLLDKCTTQQGTELPARVNVNTAAREVLLALPGLTEADADAIIAARPTYASGSSADPSFDTIAWMLTDAQIPLATMQSLERYVTARTQVYRVQSIGYFDEGGPVSRVEAVIDANQGKPRILYFRDLTDLGRSIDPRKQ